MLIKTAEGWVRMQPAVVVVGPKDGAPLGTNMSCYQLHGYASYEAWLNGKR